MSWDHGKQKYVYDGPKFRSTNHNTIPMLIESGDIELLEILLRTGHLHAQSLKYFDEMGLNPAYLAITYNRPEFLALLYINGVDLNQSCDEQGYGTPFFYAVYHANIRCLEELIRLGIDPKSGCTKFGDKPTHFAKRHEPHIAAQLFKIIYHRDHAAARIQRLLIRYQLMKRNRYITVIQRQWRKKLSVSYCTKQTKGGA
mmetsp:Transcript_13805/g.18438  ORF Transcript_13805/g.18438 Transcript_13805/m.18438 type:complete len:200 (-) Transcript_13805:13-612(-)